MKIPFSSLIWQQHTRLWVNGLTCNSKGKTLVKNTNGWTWISFGLRREVKRLISLKNHSTILIFSSKWIPDHLGWDSTKNHYKWLDSSNSGTTTSKHISWLQVNCTSVSNHMLFGSKHFQEIHIPKLLLFGKLIWLMIMILL